jgi:proline dehydrogenase
MVSFDNTEIAFKIRSTNKLNKAIWLFRFIGNNQLVKLSKPFAGIAVKIGFPFRYLIKETLFHHFCGGESIRDCEQTISELAKFNVHTILDYSVEGKETELDFDQTCREILSTQDRATLDGLVPFSVFKLTGIARFALLEKLSNKDPLTESEKQESERVRMRVEQICRKANETGSRVMMDAEESWIQPIMDELMLHMMRKYNVERPVVYNTFQLYRHDRLKVLKEWDELASKEGFFLGVKLVRGAYMEKERSRAAEFHYQSPIQPAKSATDSDYNAALEYIISGISRIALCAGTHNEESSDLLIRLMEQHGVEKDNPHVYFSQLLGMSDHISFNLSNAGYNVAKYVPYGPLKEVLPYLIRRAEENTSIAGQSSRELAFLLKEKNRRKGKAK